MYQVSFFKDWGISFVAAIGAASAFVAVLPGVSLTVGRSLMILGSCIVLSGALAYRRTQIRQLPTDEFVLLEDNLRCRLQCPATRQLSELANALAHEAFGRTGSIPADRYETWRLKNPNILACLLDSKGMVVGYFDVLPLTNTFMDRFIRGDLSESNIHHDDILSPQHARRCKRLYVAGIAVRNPHTHQGKRYARHLIWGLLRYLEHFYGAPSERQLYALGGTTEGKQILQRFKFRMIQDGSRRKDAQALYVASLADSELVEEIYAELGDWAPACRLSWNEAPSPRTQKSLS